MELEKVVDTEKINPIALKYADAILAGMPPKQAEIQRMAVTKMCELLAVEVTIESKLTQILDLQGFIKKSLMVQNIAQAAQMLVQYVKENMIQKDEKESNPGAAG